MATRAPEAADERQRQQEAEHREARDASGRRWRANDQARQAAGAAPPGCRSARRWTTAATVETNTRNTCWPRSAASSPRVRSPERDQLQCASPEVPRSLRRAAPADRGRADRSTGRSVPARRGRPARRQPGRRSVTPCANASRHVVRHDEDCLADLLLNAAKLLVHLAARDRIERAERLVHQQNRRVGGERARHADTLTLPAGQLGGSSRREVGPAEPCEVEKLAHTRRRRAHPPSQAVVGTTAMFSATVMCGKSAISCST